MIKSLFRKVSLFMYALVSSDESERDREIIKTLQNRKPGGAQAAVRRYWEKVEQGKKKVPGIAANLVPGDLSSNTDWMYIQDIGDHISPHGKDKKHKVIVYEAKRKTAKIKLAEIECTNSIYSEWLVACSNSMWHTQVKTARDIHGNFYNLGQMLNTVCTIKY